MDLNALAEQLRNTPLEEPYRCRDHSMICEAVWLMYGEGADLASHYDDDMICDGNLRLYWVLPDVEGGETLCIADGIVYVGTIESVTAMLNKKYCDDNGCVQCKRCGHFNDEYVSGVAECWSCGHYIDGTDNPELSTLLSEKEWRFIEDGDYDCYYKYLFPIPTHDTEVRYTQLWLCLQYMEGQCSDAPRYACSICAVNPLTAGKKQLEDIIRSNGWENDECGDDMRAAYSCGVKGVREGKRDWLEKEYISHGVCAHFFETMGNSKSHVVKQVLEKMKGLTCMGGFYLDAPQNRMGATGWDFMKGDPLGGMKRVTDPEV